MTLKNTLHTPIFATHPVLEQSPKFVHVTCVCVFSFPEHNTSEYLNKRLKSRPFSALEHVCPLGKQGAKKEVQTDEGALAWIEVRATI